MSVSEGYVRLRNQLLIDCAAELQANIDRIAELETENAFLQARIRILELGIERLSTGKIRKA